MTVILTLTTAGSDSGPFDLYSNTNGYATAFEIGVTKSALEGGYTTSLVPDGTTIVKVQSTGNCKTSVNIILTSVTTTTTTTIAVVCITYDLSNGLQSDATYSYTTCQGESSLNNLLGGFEQTSICAQENTLSINGSVGVAVGSSC